MDCALCLVSQSYRERFFAYVTFSVRHVKMGRPTIVVLRTLQMKADSDNVTVMTEVSSSWAMACVAPVQEIYFVKENATTQEQHLPHNLHLREVSMNSSLIVTLYGIELGYIRQRLSTLTEWSANIAAFTVCL